MRISFFVINPRTARGWSYLEKPGYPAVGAPTAEKLFDGSRGNKIAGIVVFLLGTVITGAWTPTILRQLSDGRKNSDYERGAGQTEG